jgi:poly-gamma-glutamate synthesis protein (capsule biosynthesis protein)
MSSDNVSVYAVGDMRPDWPNPESIVEMEFVLPIFKQADILFGNLASPISDKGERQVCNSGRKISPEKLYVLTDAGFNVLSFANDHHLDHGDAAFFDTIERLTGANIAVVGAGRNIEEARKPVILECKGVKVAFLAYSSVQPTGYEARRDTPGCAPLRASTFYEQVDRNPGSPPKIITMTNKEDLTAMIDDITKVRSSADVVIISMHWGVHYVPALIATYQREIAHAAIDAGADLILGHHAHILKGIETYKGKVIFYSLGNFVMPAKAGHINPTRILYDVRVDEDYRYYPYPVDCRKTMIAKCSIANKKLSKVSYLPAFINARTQPEPLSANDKRSGEVYDYVAWCCQDQNLQTKFVREGDGVVVCA